MARDGAFWFLSPLAVLILALGVPTSKGGAGWLERKEGLQEKWPPNPFGILRSRSFGGRLDDQHGSAFGPSRDQNSIARWPGGGGGGLFHLPMQAAVTAQQPAGQPGGALRWQPEAPPARRPAARGDGAPASGWGGALFELGQAFRKAEAIGKEALIAIGKEAQTSSLTARAAQALQEPTPSPPSFASLLPWKAATNAGGATAAQMRDLSQTAYAGRWARDASREDVFDISSKGLHWSRQPKGSAPIPLSLNAREQLVMMFDGSPHIGNILGTKLMWSDGDTWSRLPAERSDEQAGARGLGAGGLARAMWQGAGIASGVEAAISGRQRKADTTGRRSRDLAFVHLPCNFGHTVIKAALGSDVNQYNAWMDASFRDNNKERGDFYIRLAQQQGGALWGAMSPLLRGVDPETGCDVHYAPPKYWPADVAVGYFRYAPGQNRTVVGILRDPYDRIVNQFRLEVAGISSIFQGVSRREVSRREGSMDRESPWYKGMYETCDVNAWVKAELTKVKKGDKFRGNCHLLPQAEYFEGPNGVNLPIDNRRIPLAFNEVMERHGYNIRMGETLHNVACDVSAFSLDPESKELIQEVYAHDFDLVCKHFGYCDREEMTCLSHIPDMCGNSRTGAQHGASL